MPGSSLKVIFGRSFVKLPRTRYGHSWPSMPMPCPSRCVRESGKLANLYIGAALESQFAVRRFQKILDVPLCHAHFHRTVSCLVGGESDLRCQSHQVDFVPALDHAASGGDWSRACERG